MPNVVWIGAHYNNFTIGRYGYEPKAVVIHTMDGSIGACDSWFNNPSAQVSAHYGVGFDGAIHQYVKLPDMAYANGILEPGNRWPYGSTNPNYLSISIETEGTPGDAVTDAMYQSVKALCNAFHSQVPTVELVTTHQVISPNSRPNCPGNRWTNEYIHTLGYPVLV